MRPITSAIQRVRKFIGHYRFRDSTSYWINRYQSGGDAGTQTYMEGARFKADVLNRFVEEHAVGSIIEFGCGDGLQLSLYDFPQYTGYDISPDALQRCKARFVDEPTKSFHSMSEYDGRTADLALSLDVIYHLVEDDVFNRYMRTLFGAASRFVVIFSSCEDRRTLTPHIRHRDFTKWIAKSAPSWKLARIVRYPPPRRSFADFYIYQLAG